MTVYEDLKKAGCQIESYESDLYVRSTPESQTIVSRSGYHWEYFRDSIDGSLWIDIPGAFDPFWEARVR